MFSQSPLEFAFFTLKRLLTKEVIKETVNISFGDGMKKNP